MRLLKALTALAFVSAVPATLFAQSSPSERVRVNVPATGESKKIYTKAAMVTAFAARQVVTRKPGFIVTEGFKRKLFHISRETGLDAGTPVFPDKGDWWCTDRKNYYAGGGRFGKLCLRDSDRDGAFERVRMNRGLLMRTLDPQVPYSEMQGQSEQVPVGLKKALIYRGYDQGKMQVDYIEYIKFESDPAVSKRVSVPLPGGAGRVTVEGVTFNIVRADAYTVEYSIAAGAL